MLYGPSVYGLLLRVDSPTPIGVVESAIVVELVGDRGQRRAWSLSNRVDRSIAGRAESILLAVDDRIELDTVARFAAEFAEPISQAIVTLASRAGESAVVVGPVDHQSARVFGETGMILGVIENQSDQIASSKLVAYGFGKSNALGAGAAETNDLGAVGFDSVTVAGKAATHCAMGIGERRVK